MAANSEEAKLGNAGGCGEGRHLQWLPLEDLVYGAEILKKLLETCKERSARKQSLEPQTTRNSSGPAHRREWF